MKGGLYMAKAIATGLLTVIIFLLPAITGTINSNQIKKEIANENGITYSSDRELNERIQFYRMDKGMKYPRYFYVIDGIEYDSIDYALNREIDAYVENWL